MGHGRDVSEPALRLVEQLATVLGGEPQTARSTASHTLHGLPTQLSRTRATQVSESRGAEDLLGYQWIGWERRSRALSHRTLVLALMVRAACALPHRGVPEDVELLSEANFRRVMRDIETSMECPTLYMYPFSLFCRDLALCTLRLIPAGVEKVHASRLPSRMFVAAGLWGGLDALHFALPTQRDLEPY